MALTLRFVSPPDDDGWLVLDDGRRRKVAPSGWTIKGNEITFHTTLWPRRVET